MMCRELTGMELSSPEKVAEFKARNLSASICQPLVRDAVRLLNEMLDE